MSRTGSESLSNRLLFAMSIPIGIPIRMQMNVQVKTMAIVCSA